MRKLSIWALVVSIEPWKNKSHIKHFFVQHFYQYIKSFAHKGCFIIEDSVINKQFSKQIHGTSEMFDSITKRPCLGLIIATLAWTDGKVTIPIAFNLWINKEVAPDTYKTKIELAQELIDSLSSSIKIHNLAFDGLYATKKMFKFLMQKDIHFTGRAATNRVISVNEYSDPLKKALRLKAP